MERSKLTGICRLSIEFTICSFAGWLYEVLLNLIMYQSYTDRGVLHLPLCPIYGFGGLALLVLFHRHRGWVTVFLGSSILATVLELATFEPLRRLMGYRLWNYSAWWLNYKGMVSLPSSLLFGVMSLALIKGLDPLMECMQKKAPVRLVHTLGIGCAAVILADAVWVFAEKLG